MSWDVDYFNPSCFDGPQKRETAVSFSLEQMASKAVRVSETAVSFYLELMASQAERELVRLQCPSPSN
jgi:hypothetical protein